MSSMVTKAGCPFCPISTDNSQMCVCGKTLGMHQGDHPHNYVHTGCPGFRLDDRDKCVYCKNGGGLPEGYSFEERCESCAERFGAHQSGHPHAYRECKAFKGRITGTPAACTDREPYLSDCAERVLDVIEAAEKAGFKLRLMHSPTDDRFDVELTVQTKTWQELYSAGLLEGLLPR